MGRHRSFWNTAKAFLRHSDPKSVTWFRVQFFAQSRNSPCLRLVRFLTPKHPELEKAEPLKHAYGFDHAALPDECLIRVDVEADVERNHSLSSVPERENPLQLRRDLEYFVTCVCFDVFTSTDCLSDGTRDLLASTKCCSGRDRLPFPT